MFFEDYFKAWSEEIDELEAQCEEDRLSAWADLEDN